MSLAKGLGYFIQEKKEREVLNVFMSSDYVTVKRRDPGTKIEATHKFCP